MSFADTVVTVSQDGKKLGEVIGCMGGGIVVHVGERHWFLDAREIWRLAVEADETYQRRATDPQPPFTHRKGIP